MVHGARNIGDGLALKVCRRLDVRILADDQRRALIAQAGDDLDGLAGRRSLDGGRDGRTGHVQAARQQGGLLVAGIGEGLDLDGASFGRKVLIKIRRERLGGLPSADGRAHRAGGRLGGIRLGRWLLCAPTASQHTDQKRAASQKRGPSVFELHYAVSFCVMPVTVPVRPSDRLYSPP